ncbi:undecaprenyl-diphosphate phosphatase [Campylobacter sp. RM16190]|uniref:undecaprenyl-diphosphate phosphatase n=1 Tax=Campylobacter sp. RM16190 TaxID=1705727 RepID=UPI0014767261|nr:undecaprenyl-diphosphate phosphatase [Campylobacter sp. RM16190]
MDFLQVIVLALVQGISEFLPISSSAHLVLVPKLLGWQDQGLAFDVAVHVGTLTAILFYFKDSLKKLLADFFASMMHRKKVGDSTIVWSVGFATLPVGLCGLALNDIIEQYARSGIIIAITTILFALVLFIADKNHGLKSEYDMTIKLAFIIGLAQAIALIPGVSRSGITMSAALLLGFNRTASANFSFLMSIPVILLAGLLETVKLANSPCHISWSDLILGTVISGVSAYICVKLFVALISKMSMLPFVVYRLVLGVFLIAVFV